EHRGDERMDRLRAGQARAQVHDDVADGAAEVVLVAGALELLGDGRRRLAGGDGERRRQRVAGAQRELDDLQRLRHLLVAQLLPLVAGDAQVERERAGAEEAERERGERAAEDQAEQDAHHGGGDDAHGEHRARPGKAALAEEAVDRRLLILAQERRVAEAGAQAAPQAVLGARPPGDVKQGSGDEKAEHRREREEGDGLCHHRSWHPTSPATAPATSPAARNRPAIADAFFCTWRPMIAPSEASPVRSNANTGCIWMSVPAWPRISEIPVTRRFPSCMRDTWTTMWSARPMSVAIVSSENAVPAMPSIVMRRAIASSALLAWIVAREPSWPVFMAWSMSSTSAPRTSPTMMRSGRMRSALRTRSRMGTSPLPSRLGRRASSRPPCRRA